MRVVADDMEDPEGQGGTSQVPGQLPMAPADEVDCALEVFGLAEVLGSQGSPFDEAKDQRTRLAVDDFGRDAGGMGGAAGRGLVEAHDSVDRNVVSDPHEERASGMVDSKVRVGDAADDGHRLDAAGPTRKACSTLPGIRAHRLTG